MKTEKQIKVISKKKNYTAVDIGSFNDFAELFLYPSDKWENSYRESVS